jgi:phospholipid/cholesterol/gamma-HCH transport system ATP-binding protein
MWGGGARFGPPALVRGFTRAFLRETAGDWAGVYAALVDAPVNTRPEIVAEDLRKTFGRHDVLAGISLSIHAGELVAIVGASGCGKTVLLDHLTGLMLPDSGRVLVADHHQPGTPLVDLAELDADELDEVRLHWQIVFQRNALFSGSVRDNIALWLREHTEMTPAQIDARTRESLAAVALDVDDVINKDRDELSGGMAKRVAIARAIATDPRVVFYDEPTTGLDPVVGGHVHELIWRVHNQPPGEASAGASGVRTTIVVTHDKELLRRLRPRIVMLDRGRVCFSGSYDEFTESTIPAAEQYLHAMPVLHAREPS